MVIFKHFSSSNINSHATVPLKDSSGKLITDDKMIAEQLNIFFCSVFTNEDSSNLPKPEKLYNGDDPLVDTDITEDKVRVKLNRLQ